jgi:ribosomal protein S6--L-glutamate ligase
VPITITEVRGRDRSDRIWILTDRRYLEQRMPMALIERLRARGHEPAVVVADDTHGVLSSITPLAGRPEPSPWSSLRPRDLVLARSRHPFAPALLDEAEARGARTLNGGPAAQRVRDKALCGLALARRGLPVPATMLAHRPTDLRLLPDSAFPLVVKPVHGDNTRGVRIVATRDELATVTWPAGETFLAQAYVDAGGFDIKLYAAGEHVWATRRPSPLRAPGAAPERIPLTPELQRIAAGCRAEFGLELFGVDVLESAAGLSIVDVNEFPNYTGLDEAPEAMAGIVLGALERRRASGLALVPPGGLSRPGPSAMVA